MDITKPAAAIEIADDKAKFLIGQSRGKGVEVLYYDEQPMPAGAVSGGEIKDEEAVAKVLSAFRSIDDEALRVKVNADSASLVLPPVGLSVYQSVKSSQTISDNVQVLDINNVLSLLNREKIPGNLSIIDIVPDFFTIDSAEHYKDPPLGQKANSIAIQAKVHALPGELTASYKRAAAKAGFRVRRLSVSSYLDAQMLSLAPDMPKSCFYIDIGAKVTSVSLLSEGSPYSALCLRAGGDDLTEHIAARLSIPVQAAKSVKEAYGYDLRTTDYSPYIRKVGGENPIRQSDLNDAIKSYFADFGAYVGNAIKTLSDKQGQDSAGDLLGLPLVVGGGGADLYGLAELLRPSLGARNVVRYVPRAVGGSDPSMTALLGMILVSGTYRGSLWDDGQRVSTLSRDN